MIERDLPERKPPTAAAGRWTRSGSLWAIVLAGGEGVRLRPLVRKICGDDRPKQYVPLLESRSLLQQTIDRIASLVAPERTVLVTMRSHAAYIAGALGELCGPRVLFQPEDRGTAAAVLLPAHWILARDPNATVIVVPSDHLVVEEAVFMGHLGAVARFVQQHPEWITLLGAQPTEPETEYGWIEAGARVGWTTEGPLYRVFRFWEKPSSEVASTLLVNGCLWNTFVLVAGAGTLVAAGEECVPELNDRLARLSAFFGTEQESWAIGQAYALAPRANFSRAVLEHCPRALAVSKLPPLTWCDLGTPVRVVKTLADLGISPLWLSRLPRPACSESRHCRTCRRRECRTSRAWRWDGVRCLRSAHTLKGVGPTTTRIFLRDLRSIGDLGRAPRVDRRRPSGTIRPFVYSRSRHQISAERG